MIEITFRTFLSEFNGSKFVVYVSVLAFTLLLALRLDGLINLPLVAVLAPIWLAEFIVIIGFIVGFISFCANPPSGSNSASRADFVCMCLSMIQHCLLIAFEVMCIYKLEFLDPADHVDFTWCLVFTPLFLESLFAMVVSVWCIRHDKTFEFEMFFAVNVVQFVFVAFKLDNILHWNWVVVFMPTWILFALCIVCTIYSLLLSIFLSRSFAVLNQHRRAQMCHSLCHLILSVPLIHFLLLLTTKLDGLRWLVPKPDELWYLAVAAPLFGALFFLIVLSFGNKSANTWWFAMRKPFCNFIFDAFPCLRQYANISYRVGLRDEPVERPDNGMTAADELLFYSSSAPPRATSTVRISSNLWSIEAPD